LHLAKFITGLCPRTMLVFKLHFSHFFKNKYLLAENLTGDPI